MKNLENSLFLGNPILNCVWFVGIILSSILLKRLLFNVLSKGLFFVFRFRGASYRDMVKHVRRPFEFFVVMVAIYIAFDYVRVPRAWHLAPASRIGIQMFVVRAYECLLAMVFAWLMMGLIQFISKIFQKYAEETESKLDDQLVPFFRDLAIIAVWVFAAVYVLSDVFYVNVPALVAGLGIGGLAIALAARETLENLFASFTIFLDSPFVAGDSVLIANINGDVEHVGFRSTRIRAHDGSLVTIPNRVLTSQALENQTQRDYRRVKMYLKLRLDSSEKDIENFMAQTLGFLAENPLTKRKEALVFLENIGDFSVDVLLFYYVWTNDYWIFLKEKSLVNTEILKLLDQNKLHLAVPKQEFMKGESL
jgi:MscS family membrane protein